MTAVANPYAAQLATLDPRKVIADTAHELIRLEEQLGQEGLERSLAPGKWTARTIFCHLADCEIAFAFRFRQALAEPHHVIQPFDQDAWASTIKAPHFAPTQPCRSLRLCGDGTCCCSIRSRRGRFQSRSLIRNAAT